LGYKYGRPIGELLGVSNSYLFTIRAAWQFQTKYQWWSSGENQQSSALPVDHDMGRINIEFFS